tara:strand:- start:1024 stop:1446 length:423 start_codon:yes stop_codon:yes gene_type:complete
MGWTALSFSSGQVLTASMCNALQENFTAVAGRIAGSPKITATNHAWVTWDDDGTIFNSEGVSSVSRSQLGEYTVTWSQPFSGVYAIGWANKTEFAASDPSVRNFRAFVQDSGTVLLTYSAANNTGNAKEDANGTLSAWQV